MFLIVLAVSTQRSIAVPSMCQLEGNHETHQSLVVDQVLSDAAEATGLLKGIGILNRDYSPWNILEHKERGLVIDFSAGKVCWPPLTYYKTGVSVCLHKGWSLCHAAACSWNGWCITRLGVLLTAHLCPVQLRLQSHAQPMIMTSHRLRASTAKCKGRVALIVCMRDVQQPRIMGSNQ